MKIFILLFLVSFNAFSSPRQEAISILNHFAVETQVIQRMDLMSQIFLGLPYGDGGPLGEGSSGRYDQDPLYRFDKFDCTTFIETIIGLAQSRNINEFETKMNEIRYENGIIDYLKRNHFPSLQWIPNNISNGILVETNLEVVGDNSLELAAAEINLPGWLRNIKLSEIQVPMASEAQRLFLLEELHQLATNYNSVMASLKYISIATLLHAPSLLKKISHGSIVNFVRPNWDLTQASGTHMNVSHQGLLFWRDNILWLRHASTSLDRKVAELPFIDYLRKWENHPTLKGIHLMRLREEI